ncbi:hypothetical protein [Barrientosiimonas humi]|uniref:hypothetical protein n=1 Tax=Barrientosiimonas humi TaxID=999931 RepID=UPI0014771D05|nr:hypothetical protein [Barrientosiimonas humi]
MPVSGSVQLYARVGAGVDACVVPVGRFVVEGELLRSAVEVCGAGALGVGVGALVGEGDVVADGVTVVGGAGLDPVEFVAVVVDIVALDVAEPCGGSSPSAAQPARTSDPATPSAMSVGVRDIQNPPARPHDLCTCCHET